MEEKIVVCFKNIMLIVGNKANNYTYYKHFND